MAGANRGKDADKKTDWDGDWDFRDAALKAELITGVHETTERQAWHHVLIRLGRIAIGFTVLFAGLAMIVFPGPAIVVVPAGLAILAKDFAWAERALLYAQDKASKAKDQATGKTGTVVLLGLAAAILVYGIWYYRSDENFRCWGFTPDWFTCPE